MKDPDVGQTLLVRLDGVFDIAAAERVLATLAKAAPDSEIYIDLMHVREFHDHGVAKLAAGLVETPHRVSVRGLQRHQYRMLRYLGVSSSALDGLTTRSSATPDAA